MLKTPEDKANIPPHWMSYISVADIDVTIKKAKSLNGTIIIPKTMAGEMGSFAIIQEIQLVRILLSGNNPQNLSSLA
jgi:predicted enzyme related to lactoylglutathione lyase